MLAGEPFDLLVNLTDMQEHSRLNRLALMAGRHVRSFGKSRFDLVRTRSLTRAIALPTLTKTILQAADQDHGTH